MKKLELLWLGFAFFLLSCGGGGGSSSTAASAAAGSIDETQKELAVAAKETSAQILASESDMAMLKATGVSSSAGDIPADILKDALTVSSDPQGLQAAASANMWQPTATESQSGTTEGDCGGSSSWSSVATYDDETIYPYIFDYRYVFDNYCLKYDDYEILYNGVLTMYMVYTDQNNATFEYEYDLTYTSDIPYSASGSLSYAESCRISDGIETCSVGVYKAEATTYHTSDVAVSGNSSSGYDVSYTLTDSEGNTYAVMFTGLTLCENGHIGSGSGTMTYNNDERLSIEFVSCDQFVVTYNGYTETYSQ